MISLKSEVIFVSFALILIGCMTNIVCGHDGDHHDDDCGTRSNAVCINSAQYRNCSRGRPNGDTHDCPTGTVCTNDRRVCVTPAITIGNACAEFSNAYCITSKTYRVCDENRKLQDSIESCPKGTVCTNDPAICITAPETPPRPNTPDRFCAQKKTVGRFPLHSDTTCTKYAYCYNYDKRFMGQIGTCIGDTIFNPYKQLCVSSGYICP